MPRVSEILGAEPSLVTAARNALTAGRFTPEQVLRAVKARYIGRVTRALNSRPDPHAPFLYYDADDDVHYATPDEAKALAEATWTNAVSRTNGLSSRASTTFINYLLREVQAHLRIAISFCVSGGHEIIFMPADGVPYRLHHLGHEPEHLGPFRRYYHLHRDYSEVAFQNLSICSIHRAMICSICSTAYTAKDLTLLCILTWHEAGCLTCRSIDFLCLKKPPKYNPSGLKRWRTSARQFVDVF